MTPNVSVKNKSRHSLSLKQSTPLVEEIYSACFVMHTQEARIQRNGRFDGHLIKTFESHSPCSHHLLPQVILVVSDRSAPSANGFVLAHQNVLGDFIEQTRK